MKAAKFAVCCILTFLIISATFRALPCGNFSAYAANSGYARADAKDIYFCEKKDLNSALFIIPYTYCVEILSTDGEWYYVKYAEDNALYRALYGYCRTENLTPVSEPPENIYLNRPVTVTFKTESLPGSLPVLNELNVTVAFYGSYYSGASAYSYVLYDGAFGYIRGANDDYPLNELPDETPPPPEEPQPKSANTTVIVALVLAGLAGAALLILYLTGKKRYFHPDK